MDPPPQQPSLHAAPGCTEPSMPCPASHTYRTARLVFAARSRANDFTRTLTDVSRTLRGMGLYHTVQVGCASGLFSFVALLAAFAAELLDCMWMSACMSIHVTCVAAQPHLSDAC